MLDYTLYGALLALLTSVPLAWKWRLGVVRVAFAVLSLALLSGLLLALLGNMISTSTALRSGLVWILTLTAAFSFLAYRFYRDPERTPPDRNDVIVSPADGEVIYIHRSRRGFLPVSSKSGRDYTLMELARTPLRSEEAVVIGISMSFLDVHINRAPIRGRVAVRRHFPGRFGSLRQPDMVFENERAATVIEQGGLQVAVIQIASRLVRQIVPFVREDQNVALGERIGMIRLGSQVDVVLPAGEDLRITVQLHEQVKAGESIIAVLDQTLTRRDGATSC